MKVILANGRSWDMEVMEKKVLDEARLRKSKERLAEEGSYRKWEGIGGCWDASFLAKFSKFLEFPTGGFEENFLNF